MASVSTGVVLGSHSVKVVQVRRKGGILRLTKVANRKFDHATAERGMKGPKSEYLKTQIASAGIKSGEAMMGLSGRDLIIRYTHIPPVPDWRLGMLMKFEIEEVSEQSGGEVSADYAKLDLPESMTGDTTVLVALAKNDSLLPAIDVVSGAGLKIRGACPNGIGFAHAFNSMAKIVPGERVLLMHIGAENTDIAIVGDGRLIFARNVSGGGRLFTEAVMSQFGAEYDKADRMKIQKANVAPKSSARYADNLEEKVSNAALGVAGQFVSMVHSSVMFAKAQTKVTDLSVDRVVLGGGGANLRGLPEYLEQNLGMPVEVFDPSAAVDISGLPPDQREVFEKDPTGLVVAIGLAAMGVDSDAYALRVLPDNLRKKRQFMERDAFMIAAGAVTAVLAAILFYTSGRDHTTASNNYRRLNSAQTAANQTNSMFERVQAEHEVVGKKSDLLLAKILPGPALERGLSLVEGVIKGEGFNAVHILSVQTKVEIRLAALVVDPDDPEPAPVPEDDENRERVSVVRVEFRAEIQELGDRPPEVYTRFVGALKAEAQAKKGVAVREETLQKQSAFTFSLFFAPKPVDLEM
jgi:type IV pilus assembly protein PilM